MSALPIFPGRLQPSIFGASELNFCVRNGNRWTLTAINTDFAEAYRYASYILTDCSAKINIKLKGRNGDPYGNRTHVCGVRGRRLNRLTNGPDHASPVRDARLPFVSDQIAAALPPYQFDPRSSPSGLLTTARRFSLVRLHGLEPGTH